MPEQVCLVDYLEPGPLIPSAIERVILEEILN